MVQSGLSCLVAVEADGRRGLLTERDVVLAALGGGVAPEAPVAALAWRPLVSVAPGERADEAFRLMEAHQLRHLPVAGERGQIVAMVAIEEALAVLLHDLTELARRSQVGQKLALRGRILRAADTQVAVPSVDGGDAAFAVAASMRREGTDAVVVLEGARPAGIVTQGDLLGVVDGRHDAEATRARDLVSRPLVRVSPGDPLEEVVDRMARHGVDRVAVACAERALGVVSLQGLLAGLAFELAELLAEAAARLRRSTARARTLLH
jgi:CBS domain-containing protein